MNIHVVNRRWPTTTRTYYPDNFIKLSFNALVNRPAITRYFTPDRAISIKAREKRRPGKSIANGFGGATHSRGLEHLRLVRTVPHFVSRLAFYLAR